MNWNFYISQWLKPRIFNIGLNQSQRSLIFSAQFYTKISGGRSYWKMYLFTSWLYVIFHKKVCKVVQTVFVWIEINIIIKIVWLSSLPSLIAFAYPQTNINKKPMQSLNNNNKQTHNLHRFQIIFMPMKLAIFVI